MFNIFKRAGKYTVPSLKPLDSAVSGKKVGRKTNAEKAKEAAEKLAVAKKKGTEDMLPKEKTPKEAKSDDTLPEAAGTVPPK